MSEGAPLWQLDFGPEFGCALFERRCPVCGCFLPGASITAKVNGLGEIGHAAATCGKCGPVVPSFLGWF